MGFWKFNKNSIDSIKSNNGKIFIDIEKNNKVKILFIDNGSGIKRDNKVKYLSQDLVQKKVGE